MNGFERAKMNDEASIRPKLVKRLTAGIIDSICLVGLYFIGLLVISSTPLVNKCDHFFELMRERQDELKIQTGYGEKSYNADDINGKYSEHQDEGGIYVVKNIENPSEEIVTNYSNLLNSDAVYNGNKTLYRNEELKLALLDLFVGELIIFFIVPMCTKKRATPGNLVFGIAMIRRKYDSITTWWQVLLQFLWLFIVPTTIPLLFTTTEWLGLGLVFSLVLNTGSIFFTKDDLNVRDLVTGTIHYDSKYLKL